jgi:sensor histidine kinase YesM
VLTGTITLALGISLALHLFFAARTREIEAERRATDAQLRLLQAQIEPHFLFNTLANVHALVDVAPDQAKQMLGAFTDYLRASLGTLRRDLVPLADELALAEAYLRVQQVRMEDRLQWQIDADAMARSALLPPLLLQPLVENAVIHGLEPSVNGGTVRLLARVQGQQLLLEVRDDGRGLHAPRRAGSKPAGNGLAMQNLRDRLQTRYGAAATLHAEDTQPGTLARITLPFDVLEPATPHQTPAAAR